VRPVDVLFGDRASEIQALIRRMSRENLLWGAPRIHGKLLMLGIEVAESNPSRYNLAVVTAHESGIGD
jgi:hypothetical protein